MCLCLFSFDCSSFLPTRNLLPTPHFLSGLTTYSGLSQVPFLQETIPQLGPYWVWYLVMFYTLYLKQLGISCLRLSLKRSWEQRPCLLLLQHHTQPTVCTVFCWYSLNWTESDQMSSKVIVISSSSQSRYWLEWPKQNSLQNIPNRLGITHSQEDSFPFFEVRRSVCHSLTKVGTSLVMSVACLQ